MMAKIGEIVAYIGEGEIVLGPLSSESELLEYCFSRSTRKRDNFERKVLPCKNLGELISKANGLLAASGSDKRVI